MEKKHIAVFTIVRDEPFFLDIWCRYYTKMFRSENCYVMNNSTSDNSVEDAIKNYAINVVDFPSDGAFDHNWLRDTVQSFQRRLLQDYEIVIFAEVDEFLVSKNEEQLSDVINRFSASKSLNIKSHGYNIVHQIDSEPTICSSVDVLKNRSTMFRTTLYDKVLVTKTPLTYCRGFHLCTSSTKLFEENILLLHLQQVDLNTYHNRVLHRFNNMKLVRNPHGNSDKAQVEIFFRTGKMPWEKDAIAHSDMTPVQISDFIKTLI